MTQHKSLKTPGGGLQTKRSVLKRWERIDQLKKDGRHEDGKRIFGLPKTKPPA